MVTNKKAIKTLQEVKDGEVLLKNKQWIDWCSDDTYRYPYHGGIREIDINKKDLLRQIEEELDKATEDQLDDYIKQLIKLRERLKKIRRKKEELLNKFKK